MLIESAFIEFMMSPTLILPQGRKQKKEPFRVPLTIIQAG